MPENKTYFSSDFKLGILGGGQLGKMILTETRRYDIFTKVMDPSEHAPGRIACNEFTQGELTDEKAVLDFGKDCDLITIEIENVNITALKKLQELGKKVFPKPEVLEIIQDKTVQKKFYRDHQIPTSPFHSFNNKAELLHILENNKISYPFVWKAASGGYDGRGVQVIKGPADLDQIPDGKGLTEDFINFYRELAIVVARSENGETRCFPMVEMEFHPEANQVEFVFSPSSLELKIKNKAEALARTIVEKMDHVGLLAVEMFLTEDDDLLINEVAPRVHNSGHLTIEGNITSQFEQHLRAILNLPLGDTEVIKPAVMINLTGDEGFEGPVYYEGIEKIMGMSGAYVHLYGKAETRPFRKMGHITIVANDMEKAQALARNIKETIKVKSK